MSGWELRLLRKSNPPLLEWLKSPVVYRHDPVFAAEFGALAAEFYSPLRARCLRGGKSPSVSAMRDAIASSHEVAERNPHGRRSGNPAASAGHFR